MVAVPRLSLALCVILSEAVVPSAITSIESAEKWILGAPRVSSTESLVYENVNSFELSVNFPPPSYTPSTPMTETFPESVQ